MAVLSIGMPVYNDKEFLREALNSLLVQSFPDFELIISDDGSTDGSAEICLEFAAKDARIRYIRQERNIGISRNMEFLLKQASGTYFMWAANDDIWDREFVETLIKGFETSPGVVSVFCPMYFINDQGRMIESFGIRATDYSGGTPYQRLRKLVLKFDDAFGYGLFVREKIRDVRFPVWWWINKKCAYNNIYPTLCYYLTKGDFKLVGTRPLWFNRLKEEQNVNHKVPFNQSFIRGYMAFVLRKLNLVIASLKNIYRAQANALPVIIKIFPLMFYRWFLIPSYTELRIRGRNLLKGNLKFW